MNRFIYAMVSVSLITATIHPATAHHSAAMWDLTKEVSYSGTVSKFEWTNPHSWIHLTIPQDDGTSKEIAIECGSPAALRRSMLSWDSIKAGDKVTITASPARDGSQAGLLSSITWADGRKWVVSALASPRPDAPKEPHPPQ